MFGILRQRQGSIAVMAAIMLTCLAGFAALAVDAGILYLNREQLSNMCDAAALAGVQDLPGNPSQAAAVANAYVQQNGRLGDSVSVVFNASNTNITVSSTRNVNLFFARILGTNSSNVAASATAAVTPTGTATGIVPFGIVQQDFAFGQTYTLKEGGGSGYNGNYGALALGGNGANGYRDNIKYGYEGQLSIGQWISTEPGNMSGPTSQGVDYRIGLDPGATFESVQDGDSPRVVVVPVIESLPDHGRDDVKIVGFASFFLEGADGSGSDNVVSGKFIQRVIPGEGSDTAADFGAYSTALVQ